MDNESKIKKYKDIRTQMRKIDYLIKHSTDDEEVKIFSEQRKNLVSELDNYSTIVIAKYNKNNQAMFTYIPADSDIKEGDILTVYKVKEKNDVNNTRTQRTVSKEDTKKDTRRD